MNKKLYVTLRTALILVLLVSIGAIIRNILDYRAGDLAYEEAAKTAGLIRNPSVQAKNSLLPGAMPSEEIEPEPLDVLRAVDLAALREVNPEVAGWIELPDTGISYPLMQGENNQWYLKHTWLGDASSVGAIFLDCAAARDLSDYHTIIYGHRLRSGAMFAALRFFEDLAYWQEHPYIYIVDDAGLHRYDIFAAHAVGTGEVVYSLGDTEDEEEQAAFIRFCLDSSVIDTGIVPQPGERILTLSTCTGNGYTKRWVVQGVLREEDGGE